MTVGERIVEKRKENGITQKQLAEMAGIPIQTLVRYEKETNNIPSERLFAIAEALKTSPGTLMGWQTATKTHISVFVETLRESGASSSDILSLFTTQELAEEIAKRCVDVQN